MGYAISLNLIHAPETDDVDQLLSNLVSRQVDGIIWAIPEVGNNRAWSRTSGARPPGARRARRRHGRPDLAAVDRASTTGRSAGSRPSTSWPAGRGASAIVTGPLTWWEAQQRQLGWRDDARCPRRRRPGSASSPRATGRRRAARARWQRLLRQSSRTSTRSSPRNDQMALGVLHGAHRAGLPDPRRPVGGRRGRHRGVVALLAARSRPSTSRCATPARTPSRRSTAGSGARHRRVRDRPRGAGGDAAPADARRPRQQSPGGPGAERLVAPAARS